MNTTKTIPHIRAKLRDYADEIPSGRGARYTTGELTLGLIAAGALIGSVVGNHYLLDYPNFVNKTSLLALGGEATAFVGCYLGKVMLRKKANHHSEDLESRISLN